MRADFAGMLIAVVSRVGGISAAYRRRKPEESVLYRVIQENLSTFLERAAGWGSGRGLPTYVRQEFERYLDCGILANGFARVRCGDCGYDSVVGFSCRGRGFCPSCMGRRMADTAAHWVDHVLPPVPIRQWVLSFPREIRYILMRDSTLLTRAHDLFIQELLRYYNRQLLFIREGVEPGDWRYRKRLPWKAETHGGALTAIQRFGSSLNANPHLHTLSLDGVYVEIPETGKLHFVETPPPEREDLEQVLSRTKQRVERMLERAGALLAGSRAEGGNLAAEPADPSLMDELQAASIQERKGPGEPWKRVEVPDRQKGRPYIPNDKPFTAEQDGWSIHAGVALDGRDREKLERVSRYLLRPAFAEERLYRRPDGKVEYSLRKPRWDGGTRVVLEPLDFLAKLAALVPPPRSHTVRYSGVLAPHHRFRSRVVPPERPAAPTPEACARENGPGPEEGDSDRPRRRKSRGRRKQTDWATLILRSLKLDVLSCPKCRGRMKVISTITEPSTVRAILRSLGLSTEIPARAPPRDPPQAEFDFVQ